MLAEASDIENDLVACLFCNNSNSVTIVYPNRKHDNDRQDGDYQVNPFIVLVIRLHHPKLGITVDVLK